MKVAFVIFAILLIPYTGFARMRAILVEATTHQGGVPTVSIFSTFAGEQRIDVSIAEAASVLERANQPGDTLGVSVLVEGWIMHDPLWQLLDAISKNGFTELSYLEIDRSFEPDHVSRLSEKGVRLQAEFKTSKYMKGQSH